MPFLNYSWGHDKYKYRLLFCLYLLAIYRPFLQTACSYYVVIFLSECPFLTDLKEVLKNKMCVSGYNYLLGSLQIFSPHLWLVFLLFFPHRLLMGSYYNVSIVEIINLLSYILCFLCLRKLSLPQEQTILLNVTLNMITCDFYICVLSPFVMHLNVWCEGAIEFYIVVMDDWLSQLYLLNSSPSHYCH